MGQKRMAAGGKTEVDQDTLVVEKQSRKKQPVPVIQN